MSTANFSPPIGSDCTFTRPSDGKIIKSGSRVHPEEAEAQRLALGLRIPVPTVHNVHATPGGHTGIEMDFIRGDCLEDVWPSLLAEEKTAISHQLRHILVTMRSMPCDHIMICACGGGPARDRRRYTQYTGGPFENEADFNKFVLDLYKATPNAIRNALSQSLLDGHRMVFTHADLTPRNIIVEDGRIKALLDWEFAGWYPEYWEYVKFFEVTTACKDWKNFAEEIFEDSYPQQLVSYQALARWQNP